MVDPSASGVIVDPSGAADLLHSCIPQASFKAVSFRYGMVHIKGGHLHSPMSVTTRLGLDKVNYAKMTMSAPWLSLSTTGTRKSSPNVFGATGGLLDLLRRQVGRACDGDLESESVDADDPMDDIETEEPVVIDQRARRGGYRSGVQRGSGIIINGRKRYPKVPTSKRRIVTVDLPEEPPELGGGSSATKSVQLLIVDRRQIWLRLDDVPWAIKYLYTQHMFKGVPLVPDDSEGPGDCGTSAVAEDNS